MFRRQRSIGRAVSGCVVLLLVAWYPGNSLYTRMMGRVVTPVPQPLAQRLIPVQGVLEPPLPAPLLPQTGIVRFRLLEAEMSKHPGREFGELLIERSTGRCIYRYWDLENSSRYERAVTWRPVPEAPPDKDDPLGRPMKGAAAHDGTGFWAATFHSTSQGQIVIYNDRDDLAERDAVGRRWGELTWYNWAPLHAFAAELGCERIERDCLHNALAQAPASMRTSPGSFAVGRGWTIAVHADQSEMGIRRIEARYGITHFGAWPLPTPLAYSMEWEDAAEMTAEQMDMLTNPDTYRGEWETIVE